MRNLRAIDVPGFGPEDTVFDHHGHVFCSLRDDGIIVRVDLATEKTEVVASTGGSPLGLEWLRDGRLLVCNALLGLQTVDVQTGTVESYPCDMSFGVCNNAHVLPDGTVLVSDSSSAYPLGHYQKDIIENTASGRLIRISPTGQATVLCQNLSFANGVVCIDGGASVLVAETGTRRISRVNIEGGPAELFAEVPGHPDNMSIGSDGNIWVAVPSLPSKPLALLHRSPLFLRKFAARLPDALQPKVELCCRVIVYDSSGNLVRTLNGDTDIFNFVTGVREQNGLVAMGSIEQSCIGVFEIN